MRRTLSFPLLFLFSVILLLIVFLLIECPAKKNGPAPASKTSLPRKGGEREVPPAPKKAAGRPTKPAVSAKKVAVIMDDLGYNLEVVRAVCAFKQPVTVSILPFTPAAQETAREARACGLEIMLHLPLESLHQKISTASAGTIYTSMTGEEIRRNVEACLDQIPGCQGMNNHAGSMVTEDDRIMPVILEVLKERGLYFIDSRTTKNTIAFDMARRMGVPAASRQVFLDGDLTEAAIKAKIEELFQTARDKGQAVGICHPKKETLAALAKYLGSAGAYGVKLVFASEIVGSK
jgi:polysaccharide deacetylase 2 family uncharacterized protein YibQ